MDDTNTERKNAIELKQDKETFIEKLREKITELGISAKSNILQSIANSSHLMASVVGNELVIATFVPMIPSLIFDEVKKRVFDTEISDLSNRIDEVKNSIIPNFLETTKGRKLFQNTIHEILEQTDKEKLESFKVLLINSLTDLNVSAEEKEIRFNLLRSLTLRHMKFLKMLRNPEKYVADNRITISGYLQANMMQLFSEIFREYDVAEITRILNDLYNLGLTNIKGETLTVGMSSYGIHMAQNRLMPRGRYFVDFIMSE